MKRTKKTPVNKNPGPQHGDSSSTPILRSFIPSTTHLPTYPVSSRLRSPVAFHTPLVSDFLLMKEPPQFGGEVKEDYDLWKSQMLKFLEQYDLPPDKQFRIVNAAIKGEARKIMDSYGNLFNLNDFFSALTSIYGHHGKYFQRVLNTKQSPEEPVRVFGAKLRMYIVRTGVTNTEAIDDIGLTMFINNVLPYIQKRLKVLNPKTFEQAVDVAADYEEETKPRPVKEAKELNLIDVEEDYTPTAAKLIKLKEPNNKQITDKLASYHTYVKEQFHFVQDEIKKLHDSIDQNRNKQPSSRPSNTQTHNNRDTPRRIRCYYYFRLGHSYTDCVQASALDKQNISDKLSANRGDDYNSNGSNRPLNSRKVVLNN